MCRPHIHNKGRNSEWVPPVFYMTHPSALLHSAPRSECSQTLPGLCCNMPATPAEEWRRHLLKSGFNKSPYLVIFHHNVHVCSRLFPFKATFQHQVQEKATNFLVAREIKRLMNRCKSSNMPCRKRILTAYNDVRSKGKCHIAFKNASVMKLVT